MTAHVKKKEQRPQGMAAHVKKGTKATGHGCPREKKGTEKVLMSKIKHGLPFMVLELDVYKFQMICKF